MKFRNYFLSALSEADIVALNADLREVFLSPGEVLHEAGDAVDTVLFPSSAVISFVTVTEDGRGVESASVGAESVVGLLNALNGSPAFNRAFAQASGSAISISADRFREHAYSSPDMMRLIGRHLEANVVQAQQSVACNSLHEAAARLARWLLMTQDRVAGTLLPLTQEYLAVMLGVQRTTVTAAAGALKAAGLIRYRRGQIEVLDRIGLEARACECYAVVNRRQAALLGMDD